MIRLDYQPLFGKGARATPRKETGHEERRKSSPQRATMSKIREINAQFIFQLMILCCLEINWLLLLNCSCVYDTGSLSHNNLSADLSRDVFGRNWLSLSLTF